MTTLTPTLPVTGTLAAARILAGASRVLVLSTVSLDDDAPQATCSAADRGLWRQLTQVGQWRAPLRTGERVLSQWARQRLAQAATHQATAAHGALVRLQTLLHGGEIITDRTDLLLEAAGARQVWHLNGHVPGERCARCAAVRVRRDTAPGKPPLPCSRCGGGQLQGWPGEHGGATPQQAWMHALRSIRACDALLWLAHEDMVYPAAEFAQVAAVHGAKLVLASRTPSALDRLADVTLRGAPAHTLLKLAARVAALRRGESPA